MANSGQILAQASINTTQFSSAAQTMQTQLSGIASGANRANMALSNFGRNGATGLGTLNGKFGNIVQRATNVTEQLASGASLVDTIGMGAVSLGSKFGIVGTAIGLGVFALTKMRDTQEDLNKKTERYNELLKAQKQSEAGAESDTTATNLATIERLQGKEAAEDAKRRFEYERKIKEIRESSLDLSHKLTAESAATAKFEQEQALADDKRETEAAEKRNKEREDAAKSREDAAKRGLEINREWENEETDRLNNRIKKEKEAEEDLAKRVAALNADFEQDEIDILNRKVKREREAREEREKEEAKAAEKAKQDAEDAHEKRIQRELMSPWERQDADRAERERARAERKTASRDRTRAQSRGHSIRGRDVPQGHPKAAHQSGLQTGTLTTGTITGATLIVNELRHR